MVTEDEQKRISALRAIQFCVPLLAASVAGAYALDKFKRGVESDRMWSTDEYKKYMLGKLERDVEQFDCNTIDCRTKSENPYNLVVELTQKKMNIEKYIRDNEHRVVEAEHDLKQAREVVLDKEEKLDYVKTDVPKQKEYLMKQIAQLDAGIKAIQDLKCQPQDQHQPVKKTK